jgi:hypothetical protein
MLSWVITGSDLTYKVEFQANGTPVVPDPGSVFLTIRDNAGAGISPYVNQAQTVNTTQLELTIPGLVNTPAVPGALESRYILLSYLYGGRPYSIRQSYRLTPFLTFSADEAAVRKHLGMLPEELEDYEIDLNQAYYELASTITGLEALLQAGDLTSLRANDALAIQAALLIATSLAARYGQRVASADSEFARVTGFDPDAIVARLEARLAELVNQLTASDPDTVTNPTRFLVGTRTDPITGA